MNPQLKEKQQIIHFKGLFQKFGTIFFHYKDFPQQDWCSFIRRSACVLERRGKNGNKSVCLTYIIEKGKYSQAVRFIFGFMKALILVGIVMDDMELKDKCYRKEDENSDGAKQAFKVGFCGAGLHEHGPSV